MILIRIDTGSKSGLGHFKRVKSFIKYLNIKEYLIVTNYISDVKNLKEKKVINLYSKKDKFKNELTDAKKFLNFIKKFSQIKTVIKDSYNLGYKWEKTVKKKIKNLVVIDDNINTKHYSDFYINHSPDILNLDRKIQAILKKNNKINCKFMIGPEYALFESRTRKIKRTSDFLFYNGGAGNLLIYEKIIKRLSKNFGNKINIVVGPFSKNFRKLQNKFNNKNNVKLIHKPESIVNFLSGTKVFISSAGISMFESSFLRVPTLLLKMNNNQNLTDKGYENLGHYFCLYKNDLKNEEKIEKLLILMKNNYLSIKQMMQKKCLNINIIKKNYKKKFKNII